MKNPIIVDGHEDIAWNRLALGRDLFESVPEKRSREGPQPAHGQGIATVGYPELLAGNVRVVFSTLYASPARPGRPEVGKTYSTPQQAYDQAWEQLQYYVSLSNDPRVSILGWRRDIDRLLGSQPPKLGLVILMEGADPIVEPAQVRDWFEAGVRIVGPAWGQTRYSGGTGAPGGLGPLGKELMTQMQQVGMVLDVSHMAEQSFYEALDLFHGPTIASHSNSRAFVDTDRQLSDDMIRSLVGRGGVIGTVMYNKFLKGDWTKDQPKGAVGLEEAVRHIRHICELAGDSMHAAIGSDLDGGYGAESTPGEVDTIADLAKLGEMLSHDMSDTDVANILGENWIRFLRRALPD